MKVFYLSNLDYKFFSFLFLIVFNVMGQDTATLSGSVLDGATGERLIGASVYVKDLPTVGTTTNAYGYFSISLPIGNHTLVIDYLGYDALQKELNFVNNAIVTFKLVPHLEQLTSVEINVAKKNTQITTTNLGVEKLAVKDIRKIPVIFGEQDVIKVLTLTPGVKTTNEGTGGMFVRGGNTSQNLVLLDEATVYNPNHFLGFFSTFNSDAIKDVELYKGTAPASFGGRISSVLDVRMNEGNNQQFRAGLGIGLISSKLQVEGPIIKNKASFLLSGRRTYADLLLFPKDSQNKLYFYDLNLKTNATIDQKNSLFVSGYLGRDVFNFDDVFGMNWGNTTGTLRWNHLIKPKLFSNTSLIYANYDYQIQLSNLDTPIKLFAGIKSWELKHIIENQVSYQNKFIYGVISSYQTIQPGQVQNTDETLPSISKLPNKNTLANSVFVSQIFKPSTTLNFEYGGRLSLFQLFGGGQFYTYDKGVVVNATNYGSTAVVQSYMNFEPRCNVVYIIDKSASTKLNYTRNVQNLHLVQNADASAPTDIWLPSSKNLKPEISDQFSLGYFRNFKNHQYQFSAESYFRWMQNQIDLKDNGDIGANEFLEGELATGVGRAYGLELMLKKKYGIFTGWMAYTLSRTERKMDEINQNQWYVARQDATQDFSFVGMLALNKKWDVSATWVYHTGNAVTVPVGKEVVNGNESYIYSSRNGFRMPAYHRLDIGATKTIKKTAKHESSLNYSIYNVYARKNAFSMEIEDDPNDPTKVTTKFTHLFRLIPSISYQLKF